MELFRRVLWKKAAYFLVALTVGVELSAPLLSQQAESLAPFVPSPPEVVEKMLELAEVKPGEVVYDLGCGDGRIVIMAAQKFKAKGVGVELQDDLVKKARQRIRELGLEGQVEIIQGDLMKVDVSKADVVTLYLLTDSNEKLKPKLLKELKPGARIVSHDFEMRNWVPEKIVEVEAHGHNHTIYVYRMPPKKKDPSLP